MKCATVPDCAKRFRLSAYEGAYIETNREALAHPGTPGTNRLATVA